MRLLWNACLESLYFGRKQRRTLLVLAAGVAALIALRGWVRPATVLAQDTPYTLESLRGDYGYVGAYSGDVARLLGTAYFDSKGNMNGSAKVVILGGEVKNITYTGKCTLNSDGTGKIAITVYGVALPPPVVTVDIVVTKARFVHGVKMATEIQEALEGPSVVVTGQQSFVTHVFTRRAETEELP